MANENTGGQGTSETPVASGNSGSATRSTIPWDPDKLTSEDVWCFASFWLFTPGSPGWIWSSLYSLMKPVDMSVFWDLENFLRCFSISSFSAGDDPTQFSAFPMSARPASTHLHHSCSDSLGSLLAFSPFLRVMPRVSVVTQIFPFLSLFHHLPGCSPPLWSETMQLQAFLHNFRLCSLESEPISIDWGFSWQSSLQSAANRLLCLPTFYLFFLLILFCTDMICCLKSLPPA